MNCDDLSNLVRTTTSREQLLSADSSSLEGTTWEDSSCSGLLQSTHGMDSTSSANVVADDFLHFGLDSSKSLMLQGCVHEKFHVYKVEGSAGNAVVKSWLQLVVPRCVV